MIFTQDMKEFIEFLEKYQVEYVVVGGFAVNYYGYIRTTQDIMIKALDEFGFGSAGITRECFESAGTAVHLGVEPNRIDLLTNLKGVSNEEIFKRKKRIKYEKMFLNIISLKDLLECKRCSDRPKDLADVDELEKTIKEKEIK
jgi:predicted nucleotidyltransferase